MSIIISVADARHKIHAVAICQLMEDSAKIRGTGIAKREPAYIEKKMDEGKCIIALDKSEVIGFCYIESWEGQRYVANSGLIVHPDFRGTGIAKKIKEQIFILSKKLYPNASIFGITTSLQVMKINSDLGYKPVTFSELTQDAIFWKGCETCANFDILQRTNRKMCLCTGMLYKPSEVQEKKTKEDKLKAWNQLLHFLKIRTAIKATIIQRKTLNHEEQ
ncbi:MAG: GNAT family N-acetyltransferase [Crocinitomicaceae bacterium]|jgi:GNAT superfamily N-acetyltransferase|nr:GNAT family N-acetyltransferase [Crocinitomicaceae bacterium]